MIRYVYEYISAKYIAFERIHTLKLTKNLIFLMIDFGRMDFDVFANLSFMQNREKFKNHKTSAQLARSDCRAPTIFSGPLGACNPKCVPVTRRHAARSFIQLRRMASE